MNREVPAGKITGDDIPQHICSDCGRLCAVELELCHILLLVL